MEAPSKQDIATAVMQDVAEHAEFHGIEARQAFVEFDTDRSGNLDVDEFQDLLQDLGVTLPHDILLEVWPFDGVHGCAH